MRAREAWQAFGIVTVKGKQRFPIETLNDVIGISILGRSSGMAGIFDEKTMMQAFEKSIPNEEALHAGVKGIIHAVNRKICFFDVYIGITQNYLIVVECEEQGAASSLLAAGIEKKTEDGAGICLPFSQVKSCVLQKGIMGSIRCSIALKSGYSIRLQMPKRAGLAGNMPHHLEYRDKILARLRALSGTQK